MTRGSFKFLISFLIAAFLCGNFANGQTDAQLRDPEFLIKQYNDLAAKHNALVEKTRSVVMQKLNEPPVVVQSADTAKLQDDLNEALGQISALEAQLLKLKQEGLRSVNSNQYLDETNARLRRQLQQLKADEKELEVRNQELALENRKLEQAQDNFNSSEESAYAKIRNLELLNSTLERKAKDLRTDMSSIKAENNKLEAQLDRSNKENAKLNQKIASLGIDQETADSKISEMKTLMRDAQNEAKMLENEEIILRDELMNSRNEIARLNGILALEQDRSLLVLDDKEDLAQKVSDFQVETDALRAQVDNLQETNINLTIEAQRQAENARLVQMTNNDLRAKLERLSNRNNSMLDTDMAQKEELTALRAELNSLAMQESRISTEMTGLRDSNEMLLAKTSALESENADMLRAVNLMREEIENIEANERNLITKLKDLDQENQDLMSQSGSLHDERGFFKDKSRDLEIQLNRAVANERLLSQEAGILEANIRELEKKIKNLENAGTSDYQKLLAETRELESEYSEVLAREQVLIGRMNLLEKENVRLEQDMVRMVDRETDLNNAIISLKEDIAYMDRELESSMRMRERLKSSMIEVIDRNERLGRAEPVVPDLTDRY
jgi:chromosome segregation ATPase